MYEISKIVATVTNSIMLVILSYFIYSSVIPAPQDRAVASFQEAPAESFSKVSLPDVRVLLNRWSGSCRRDVYDSFDQDLLDAAKEFKVEPDALFVVVKAESACNVKAIGKLGEIGLGQVYPEAWKGKIERLIGLDSWDEIHKPRQNLRAAAFLLSDCISRKGLKAGFSCYNGTGPMARAYGESRHREFLKFTQTEE